MNTGNILEKINIERLIIKQILNSKELTCISYHSYEFSCALIIQP